MKILKFFYALVIMSIASLIVYNFFIYGPKKSNIRYLEFYNFEGQFEVRKINIELVSVKIFSDSNKFYFQSGDQEKLKKIKKGDFFIKKKKENYFTITDKNNGSSFYVKYKIPEN